MARDDYFVIVYKILTYLYDCLKAGDAPSIMFYGAKAMEINRGYWLNIMESLNDEGYIRGIEIVSGGGGYRALQEIDLKITPKGIEFLQDNSMMEKAKAALRTIKEIVPEI